jgi:hypothetical protein
MLRSALAGLLAVVVLSGCNDLPPVGTYAIVYGRVYDGSTSMPLAGVDVTVDSVDVATTATDGTFSIGTIPAGPTDVIVSVPAGYHVADESVLTFSVHPGDRYLLNLPLMPN